MTRNVYTDIHNVQQQMSSFLRGLHDVADGRQMAITATKFEEAFLWLEQSVSQQTRSAAEANAHRAHLRAIEDFASQVRSFDGDELTVEAYGDTVTINAHASGEPAFTGTLADAKEWYETFKGNLKKGLRVGTKDEEGNPISITQPYAKTFRDEAAGVLLDRELSTELVDSVDATNAD